MTSKVKPIPEGYRTITPYLFVKNGAAAIDYYKKAFGAQELMRMEQPNGKIGHAELMIGDSKIMLADECPEMHALSPQGTSPVSLHLYVEDVDTVAAKAVAAGGTLLHPVSDKFYGDRSGSITDPFGHLWYIATHVEDLSPEEIGKRAEIAMKQGQQH
jgi:PhnB protein